MRMKMKTTITYAIIVLSVNVFTPKKIKLKLHEDHILNNIEFLCYKCDYSAVRKSYLNTHMIRHHGST